MEKNNPIIISGSSITNDLVWPTWATWITELYGLTNVRNLSVKGLGNKAIILKAIQLLNGFFYAIKTEHRTLV